MSPLKLCLDLFGVEVAGQPVGLVLSPVLVLGVFESAAPPFEIVRWRRGQDRQ